MALLGLKLRILEMEHYSKEKEFKIKFEHRNEMMRNHF